MAQITYTNKVAINENPNVADINKVKADDMNEIKSVVNENDTNVGTLSNLNTTDKSSIVNAINEVNGMIESGSSGDNSYIKYADGTLICYCINKSYNSAVQNAWGVLYSSGANPLTFDNFSCPFVSTPAITTMLTPASGAYNAWLATEGSTTLSKTNPGSYQAIRPTATELSYFKASYIAIGKWK